MAGKKGSSNKSASRTLVGTISKSSRRCGRSAAASALAQAPIARRSEGNTRARRAELTADELGLRAWKTTYENKRTKAR